MAGISTRRTYIIAFSALVILLLSAGLWWALTHSELAAGRKITLIPPDAKSVRLLTNEAGELIYRVNWRNGTTEDLAPVRFAELIEADFESMPVYMRLLNVTSTAGLFWIGVGLLAQVIFMARMLVQWAASEKEKRSVVPPMFWWLSLIGASMLIVYFVWRRDAIGVLGQATGWVVYIRNIMLVARERNGNNTPAVDALDEEPALADVP